jgi:apolipoprotein D and lipocalin family protein
LAIEEGTVRAVRSARLRWCRRSRGIAAVVATLAVAGGGTAAAQDQPVPVQAIPALDLERYAGLWHEVARLPNRFQKRCVGDVTASYDLLDGAIRVVNTCRVADGTRIRAEGRARLARRDGPASRLKVRFAPALLSFLPMVWADYWVLDLTDNYDAALVGTPDRRYLWVLSRRPELDSATYSRLVGTAARQGFDIARLQRSSEP